MDASENNKSGWQNVTLALSVGLLTAAINPNLSLYLHERFQVDPTTLGWILGLNSVAGLIFTLLIPWISDQVSDLRKILSVVNLLAFSGLAAVPFISDIRHLSLALIALLGPYSALSSLFFTYIRRSQNCSSTVIRLRSFFSVSWVVGPAAATSAMAVYGVSSIFVISAALCFLNAVFIWTMPKTNPPTPNEATSAGVPSHKIVFMFIGFLLLLGANFITGNVMSLILREELNIPLSQVGFVASLAAAFEVPLFFLLPYAVQRCGRGPIFKAGCFAGITYCVGLFLAKSYSVVFILQLFNGIFVTSVIGIGLAWFQELRPAKVGFMTGLFSNATRLSAIMSAPVIAATASYFSTYRGAVLAATIMVAVGTAILLPLVKAEKKDSVEHS